jgi:hypothetical protein
MTHRDTSRDCAAAARHNDHSDVDDPYHITYHLVFVRVGATVRQGPSSR